MKQFNILIFLAVSITAWALLIIVQNQTQDVFATINSTLIPNLTSPFNANISAQNNDVNISNSQGFGPGYGTGGPEAIASILSEPETNTFDQQANNGSLSPTTENTTNIFHSQGLAVNNPNIREGDFSDSITGTIVNNSPIETDYIDIVAALFDINGNLITMVPGSVDFSSLKSTDDTSFKIDINNDIKDTVDHYMLFVVGTPSR